MATKVTAKFEIAGAIMYSKEEAAQNKEYVDTNFLTIGHTVKGKYVKENLMYTTRKTKPVYQVINISDTAFHDWMNFKPSFTYHKYFKLNQVEKTKLHLEEIAKNLNAKLIDFTILPD